MINKKFIINSFVVNHTPPRCASHLTQLIPRGCRNNIHQQPQGIRYYSSYASSPSSSSSSSLNTMSNQIDFNDIHKTYSKLTSCELIESYMALSSCQLPVIKKFGPQFLEFGGDAAKYAAKFTYFKYFCGGETLQDNQNVVRRLHNLGLKTILDYSVEGSVSEDGSTEIKLDGNEQKEESITQVVIDSILFMRRQNDTILGRDSTRDVSSENLPCPMAVVKFTGISDCNLLLRVSEVLSYIQQFPNSKHAQELLGTQFVLYNNNSSSSSSSNDSSELVSDDYNQILKLYAQKQPRTPAFSFSEDKPPRGLNGLELEKWKRVLNRIDRICIECKRNNISLLIDAEQSWVQPAIDLMAVLQSLKFNVGVSAGRRPIVHNTYQLYLKDGLARLEFDHNFILNHSSKSKQGVKLVRGAYIQSETKRCDELKLPYPFNNGIDETHRMYHKGVEFTLQNIAKSDNMAAVLASHNPDTLIFATNLLNHYQLSNNDPRVMFAQLYGMGDSLSLALANNGYNIGKYVPFGPVDEVLPYLSRRLVENSDMMGGSAVETRRLKREICNRVPFWRK